MMNIKELRQKSLDDLKSELFELLQESFKLRVQKNFSTVAPHTFKRIRKNIARIKTLIHQAEMKK